MVSDDCEVAQSSEEEMKLLDGPCNCQAFQLNDSISAFCIGVESRPSLYHPPARVAVGWLLEKEEVQNEGASICVEAGLLGGVEIGEHGCSHQQLLSLLEGYVMVWCPEEVIACTQKWPQWC